jgi:hypothetical protein
VACVTRAFRTIGDLRQRGGGRTRLLGQHDLSDDPSRAAAGRWREFHSRFWVSNNNHLFAVRRLRTLDIGSSREWDQVGVTALVAVDWGLVPRPFVAATLNLYD